MGVVARYFDPGDPPSDEDIDGIVQWATQRDAASAKSLPENFGDISNGRRFAAKFRGLFLYVHAVKRWLRWDGMRWAVCANGEALHAAGFIAQDALDDAHAARGRPDREGQRQPQPSSIGSSERPAP